MTNTKLTRYPGVVPFSPAQAGVFKGRAADSQQLFDLLLRHQLTLLYAKSGLGKSSLINAGLLPLLAEKSPNVCPIFVRLRTFSKEGESILPVQNIIQNLQNYLTAQKLSERLPETAWLEAAQVNKNSLWFALKRLSLLQPEVQFLLIFDQFEELFTYPKVAINQFKKQWAEVLYKDAPESLWEQYAQNPALFTEAQLDQLEQPIPVKLLFAIREDKYSLLYQISDTLPSLTQNNYALKALTEAQAREAILLPAQAEGAFSSQPFTYQSEAVQAILSYLTKGGEQAVETTQLQILCNRIEDLALSQVRLEDIPDFEDIFQEFYLQTLSQLPADAQAAARHLIENELIQENRRISLDEVICLRHLSQTALEQLVNAHLLRTENNHTGGKSYEVAHDTLIDAIMQAKKIYEAEQARLKEEKDRIEEERQLKAQAEQDKLEKQKIQKQLNQTRLLLGAALLALLIAVGAVFFAVRAQQEAEKAKENADKQAEIAKKEKSNAEKQTEIAKSAKDNADKQAKIAEEEKIKADEQAKIAKKEKEVANQEKERAEEALRKVAQKEQERQRAEARILLNKATSLMNNEAYQYAIIELEAAKKLDPNNPMIDEKIKECKAKL